jgi:hypothetical protein
MNRNPLILICFAAPLLLCAQAQDRSKPTNKSNGDAAKSATALSLNVTGTVESQFSGPIFGHVKCDEDGNVYLRGFTSERSLGHTLHQTPIQKVKADGTVAEYFSINGLEGQFWAKDFFVTADGKVSQIVYTSKEEFYVFEFSADGSVKGKTTIQTDYFSPNQLAVFKSGEFLLSGTLGKGEHTPFTGVFSSSGKLIRKVTTQKDDESAASAEAGDPNVVPSNGQGNLAVLYGEAVAAVDGNVYLMRSGSRAWVHAVSPSGEVLRSFYVDSGDSGLVAASMKAAPGRLVIAFRRGNVAGILLKVVDLEGNPIGEYASTENKFPAAFMACYLPPAFIFTQPNAQGLLRLHKAEPR